MLISEQYRLLNKQLHESNPHYGTTGGTRAMDVAKYADHFQCWSILDYGCGRGGLKAALTLREVREYDPAIPGKDDRPEPAHLVYCGDVLEHVEPECLEAVLDDLASLTLKAFVTVTHTGVAKKILADGRNAHLTQQPAEWWLPKLWTRWHMVAVDVGDHGFHFVGTACSKST